MQSVAVPQRHLLLWRDSPSWPFMWYGLAPLLALAITLLYALGPFARASIEAPVQREVREQLSAVGFGWVGVAVSGQNVTLSGEQPAAGAGERAVAAAQAATCPTWLGRQRCAARVAGQFTAPAPPALAAAPAVTKGAARACERSLAHLVSGQQIEFTAGSAAISARSGGLLDQLAREALACPGTLRIEGHTDGLGRAAFNQNLSETRAAAVRDALIARGVPAEKLRSFGYGAARPVADNRSARGRARNRRIEFHADSTD